MPAFCTKCGSPVAEGLKFCPKCGNALAASPAPIAGPAPAAAPPAPKKGSPVLKIVLAVVGVLFLIMVIAMAGVFYVGYRIKKKAAEIKQTFKMDQAGQSLTIHTPKGAVVIGENKEAEAAITKDVPPYPGAKKTSSGGISDLGGRGFSAVDYETSDPVDTVVAFYKEKLGSRLSATSQTENAAYLQMTTATEVTTIAVNREPSSATTKISISRASK